MDADPAAPASPAPASPAPAGPATDPAVAAWWEVTSWRAFDVRSDGRVLAGHDASGSVQLVELAPGGPARPLTRLPGAVTGRWVPGRDAVVVQHDDGGDENAQLSLLQLSPGSPGSPGSGGSVPELPAGLADLVPLVRAPGVVHRLLDVREGAVYYATNARNHVDFDVLVHDLDGPGPDRVLYDGGGHVADVAVAPDGRRLLLTVTSLVAMSSHLVLVEHDGSTRVLTDAAEPGRHDRAAWDADGTAVWVSTDADFDTTLVARLDLRTGRSLPVVAHDDWDVAAWPSPDGALLLTETFVDGESRLALHDPRTGRETARVELPGAGTPASGSVAYATPDPVWAPDSSCVVLSFTAPGVPGDVLLLDPATGALTALTDSAGPLADRQVAEPVSHLVPTPDGENVPAFRYPAAGGAQGADRPGSSVLVVHGGPEGQSVRRFDPLVQALSAAGHTVVVPNVRGSTGYGRRWYSLDDGPRRLDSVADLAALHDWLPSVGLDPARSALWGGSYGGYMVLAGLTFQPERWAAGVDVVGISSLVTFLENTSGYRRAVREREYGRLETDREMLEAASPLPRIDAVRAPLFVVHGANDPRVPLSEAEQVVAAVRSRGLECELRVYADEGHGLARRVNRLDAYPAAVGFLHRHLA